MITISGEISRDNNTKIDEATGSAVLSSSLTISSMGTVSFGFNLLELIVVTAIVGILVAIALNLNYSYSSLEKQSTCGRSRLNNGNGQLVVEGLL